MTDDDDSTLGKKKDGAAAAAPAAPTEVKGAKNFAAEDQEKLRASIRVFLNVCKRGLDENKKLCQTDGEHQLQANLDKQFDELCSAIRVTSLLLPILYHHSKQINVITITITI